MRSFALLVSIAVAFAAPCLAQTAPSTPAQPSGPAASAVDESALRYYARNNQIERAEAEIRRLQVLHPGWTPPDDIFLPPSASGDEQALWDLFAADRLDELQAAIDARKAAEPAWRPSADLQAKLAYKRSRQRLVNASDAQQWGKVLEIGTSEGFSASCEDIDVFWRMAEAYARTAAPDQALTIYRTILTECTVPQERLATVQKALAALPPTLAEPLLALGNANPDGTGEFDSIRIDLFRAKLGAAAAGSTTEAIDAGQLAAFEAAADTDTKPDDAGLLGWFHYGNKKYEPALAWFQKALQRGGDVKLAEGAVLTLSALERPEEAEALAVEWADKSEEVQSLFLGLGAARLTMDPPPKLEPRYIEKFAAASDAAKAGDAAQALGWYRYNTENFADAKVWFTKAMEWSAKDTTALGLVLSTFRLGEWGELKKLVDRFSPTYPTVAAIAPSLKPAGASSGKSRRGRGAVENHAAVRSARIYEHVNDLFAARRYKEALALVETSDDRSRGMQMVRGWTYYHVGRYPDARRIFSALDKQSSTRETRQALGLVLTAMLPARTSCPECR